MASVTIATTAPSGVLLQLENAPNFYAATPAYSAVTIRPAALGGGAEYQQGATTIQASGVDENFWNAWTAENSASPLLATGVVAEV